MHLESCPVPCEAGALYWTCVLAEWIGELAWPFAAHWGVQWFYIISGGNIAIRWQHRQ